MRVDSSTGWIVVAALLLCTDSTSAAGTNTALAGTSTMYVVAQGDTLASIAARFGVYPATIAADNGIERSRPLEPGRALRIDNRHIVPGAVAPGVIVVNIPQRMVFVSDSEQVIAYPVAVGRATWQTPTGAFTILTKDVDPAWHPPESIRAESARAGHPLPLVVPPGARNPLGHFWIGLSLSSIGIHGTPAQSSIYQTATHGCIRLQRHAIEDVFTRAAIGTKGFIIYEPILVAEVGDDVFLEVHLDVYGRLLRSAHDEARVVAARAGVDDRIDWSLVDQEIDRHAGVARRVSSNR